MQDSIVKGQGNSRYLKSVANFKALYPTYDDFVSALVAGTLPVDFNGKNAAGWQQIGTELSKTNLMSDQSAYLFNLSSSNVPDDIFDVIGKGLPIRNGGTGATNASSAFYNIVSALSTVSSASSSYYIPMQYSSSGRRISYTNLANAIKNTVASTLTPQDIGAATVEIGSYSGNGSYGQDKTYISFSTAPKVVFIRDNWWTFRNADNRYELFPPVILMNQVKTSYDISRDPFTDMSPQVAFRKSSDGKTLYYWSDSALFQFNESGQTYWYAGIL